MKSRLDRSISFLIFCWCVCGCGSSDDASQVLSVAGSGGATGTSDSGGTDGGSTANGGTSGGGSAGLAGQGQGGADAGPGGDGSVGGGGQAGGGTSGAGGSGEYVCSLDHPFGACPDGTTCNQQLGYCATDPSLPCRTIWEADESLPEQPLCAALHSKEFLLSRTGTGQPHDEYVKRFDDLWRAIDEGYGAFAAIQIDWSQIKTKYQVRVETAASRYEQLDLVVRMFDELHDSHTGYFDLAACGDLTALTTYVSPFKFYVSYVDSELAVFASDDPKVHAGDRIVSVNGLSGSTLRTFYQERLKCGGGNSSSSAADAEFTSSVLALAADPLFRGSSYEPLLGVVVEGADGQFLVRPAAELKPEGWTFSQVDKIAYSTGASPIKLESTQYDTGQWGNHQPGYIWHTMVDQLAIMVLYDFLGESDFERALREVVQKYPTAKGWLIDERMNTGGGPHQDTLASFFLDEPIDVPAVATKSGAAHDALTPCPPTTCASTIAPDTKIHVTAPVAVLTSGFTVSAGDFFAYDMKKAPRARIFGQPTTGAFGNVSVTQPDSTISYSITWTQVSDTDGTLMQGHSIQPHEIIGFKKADVLKGVDTVFESARAWLVSQQ